MFLWNCTCKETCIVTSPLVIAVSYLFYRYDEIRDYDFQSGKQKRGSARKPVGHFTQMVWTTTTKMGMGIARNTAGTKVYVVAHYSPPGNFVGAFTKRVMRLKN